MIGTMISFILSHWFLFLWLVAVGLVLSVFGWRPAFAALIVGAGYVLYKLGQKRERDNLKKRSQDIQKKREKAYEEIDSRNSSGNDVIDRLRRRSY